MLHFLFQDHLVSVRVSHFFQLELPVLIKDDLFCPALFLVALIQNGTLFLPNGTGHEVQSFGGLLDLPELVGFGQSESDGQHITISLFRRSGGLLQTQNQKQKQNQNQTNTKRTPHLFLLILLRLDTPNRRWVAALQILLKPFLLSVDDIMT